MRSPATDESRNALAAFNAMAYAEAASLLQACAAIPWWTGAVLDGRPYDGVEELLAQADLLAKGWTEMEVDAALAQHPRIGQSPTGDDPEARMSADEQSAVAAEGATTTRIHAGNAAYETKFGRVFLIRARGRDAGEILAELERRLDNDEDAERVEVAVQLREIALLRLASSMHATVSA